MLLQKSFFGHLCIDLQSLTTRINLIRPPTRKSPRMSSACNAMRVCLEYIFTILMNETIHVNTINDLHYFLTDTCSLATDELASF